VSQEKRRKKVIFHRERRPGFICFGLNEKLEGKKQHWDVPEDFILHHHSI